MDAVLVVLAVAVVGLLVALVVLLRRRPDTPGPTAEEIRSWVGAALQDPTARPVRVDESTTDPRTPVAQPTTAVAPVERPQAAGATTSPGRGAAPVGDASAEATRPPVPDARTVAALRRAEDERDGLRTRVGELERAAVERERSTAAELAQQEAALAGERAELHTARERLQASLEALADDQRRLAADRERVRHDETELDRAQHTAREQLAAARRDAAEAAARGAALDARDGELDRRAVELQQQAGEIEAELTRVSGLTAEHARAEVLARQEELARRDAALLSRSIEAEAEATAKQRARAIVADAIQRVAGEQTAQTVVSVVQLPSDDLKGRIIGREGRNIRAFETITGVNVIIDDTPEAVLLSCFDPVRREIGRITLEMLVEDGRIHPHRIEEVHLRATDEVEARCARAAQDALLDVGIGSLHPELQRLLGHLRYRTSYGQNVLGHLVECAHIARSMAAELGIDPRTAVRGAFLHDIGKALTHEAQGSHAAVGAELARRYGESEEVAHCIEAHHDEVTPTTVEAVLTQAADACSGGRPGARRESLEAYVQRLERIESIASAKKGVEKVFAMQAGRELRVMVKPDVVDDLEAHVLAREVAKQIEEELTYPGQVRVTVIRESRATEVAR